MSSKDVEKLKKDLFNSLSVDLDRMSQELSTHTHDMVIQAVENRMSGVVNRLERGVAMGLAEIAGDLRYRVDA